MLVTSLTLNKCTSVCVFAALTSGGLVLAESGLWDGDLWRKGTDAGFAGVVYEIRAPSSSSVQRRVRGFRSFLPYSDLWTRTVLHILHVPTQNSEKNMHTCIYCYDIYSM